MSLSSHREPIEAKRQRLAELHAAMVDIQRRRGAPRTPKSKAEQSEEERQAIAFRVEVVGLIAAALKLLTSKSGDRTDSEAAQTARSAAEVFLSELGVGRE